ncbi:MAG: class I SAM-dependent methyltransferase [Alphaproteobacteria bacterium]|nr:class I SAM-dependent methyltransferase [Alphaproteobacteria bacterium]
MTSSAPASDWSEVDQAAFLRLLAEWIDGFVDSVGVVSNADRDRRFAGYVEQEKSYAETVRYLLEKLPDRPRQALDIGSAAGGLSCAIALENIEVEGVEPLAAGVAASRLRAKRLGLANARFREGVGERLPFGNDTFDLAVSVAVLEHVQDQQAVLSEIFRVLRPSGHLYIEVPNYLFPFEPHYKIAWLPMMPKSLGRAYARARGFRASFLDGLHYTNRPKLKRLLTGVGFTRLRDSGCERIAAKFVGASWSAPSPRVSRLPPSVRRALAAVFAAPAVGLFGHRAIGILAKKPPVD